MTAFNISCPHCNFVNKGESDLCHYCKNFLDPTIQKCREISCQCSDCGYSWNYTEQEWQKHSYDLKWGGLFSFIDAFSFAGPLTLTWECVFHPEAFEYSAPERHDQPIHKKAVCVKIRREPKI